MNLTLFCFLDLLAVLQLKAKAINTVLSCLSLTVEL